MNKTDRKYFEYIFSMIIFGSIGIFVRFIDIPSSVLVFFRSVIGFVFLLLVLLLSKKKTDFQSIKNNFLLLLFSGFALGVNWIFLFEAYKYISVSKATLCYYVAPLLVVLAAPVVFKEKLGIKKYICIAVAFFGMILVSGIFTDTGAKEKMFPGMIFALLACVFYALVMILNKKMKDVESVTRSAFQFAVSAIVTLIYALFSSSFSSVEYNIKTVLLILVVGVIHTGFAYLLYFDAVPFINSGTLGIICYVDPCVAVILSSIIFKEIPDVFTIIGGILIIGASIVSETNSLFKKEK